jgi:hypothetical protein
VTTAVRRALTDPAWRHALALGAFAFVASRIAVLVGAGLVSASRSAVFAEQGLPRPTSALPDLRSVLSAWDGRWYVELARLGYPQSVPPGITYDQLEARAAFFPLYPLLIRLTDLIVPGDEIAAAIAVNVVLGALAVFALGLVARRWWGPEAAGRAMVVVSLFPGSVVLSMCYAEPLLLVAAAGCLLALADRRWLLAGLAAAVGTATRPNGLALVVACAVAAALAIRSRREWRALLAPALAPLGFLGFQAYLAHRTGEAAVWFRVQREAWDEGTSFGWRVVTAAVDVVRAPLSSPANLLTVASVAVIVTGFVGLRRHRIPAPDLAYTAVIVFLMLLPATVTARPRFVLAAFPLVLVLAVWQPRRPRMTSGAWWTTLVATEAALLVTLTALFGIYAVVP